MKTITLDFELYKNELRKARSEGFSRRPDMQKELKRFLIESNSYDNKIRQEALINIRRILVELDEVLNEQ